MTNEHQPTAAAGTVADTDTSGADTSGTATATATSDADAAPETTPAPARNPALDVLRGVALCGILFVNIGPQTDFMRGTGVYAPYDLGDASGWLQLFVQQRFFPIFSLLFGIGFSLFLASAARRTDRPRLLLLRRLLLLLAIGIPFEFLQPGSALWPYALAGLVVLLPSTWLPRWAVAAGAVALLTVSLVVAGGGITLIPGLFLLGSTLTRYGVVPALGRARLGSAVALAAFTAAAVPLTLWQAQDVTRSGFDLASAAAGLAMAGAYVALVSLLMATRASGVLTAVFAPLGRTALTNYVTAAPLMLVAGLLLDLPHSTSWALLLGTAAVILGVQGVVSALWLRRFRQGPLEWLWRWGTWGRRPPLLRATADA